MGQTFDYWMAKEQPPVEDVNRNEFDFWGSDFDHWATTGGTDPIAAPLAPDEKVAHQGFLPVMGVG